LPDSVTKLGGRAFYGNTRLNAADVGNGLAVLAPEVFAQCTALRAVVVGRGVTSIKAEAFAGDRVLSWIQFQGSTLPTIHPTAFSGVAPGAVAHVLVEGVDGYGIPGTLLNLAVVQQPVSVANEIQKDIDDAIDDGVWAQKTNVKRPGTGDN